MKGLSYRNLYSLLLFRIQFLLQWVFGGGGIKLRLVLCTKQLCLLFI
jgi:hypothetical protein